MAADFERILKDVETGDARGPDVAGIYPVRMRIVVVFPAPLGPEETENFAWIYGERDVVNRCDRAISLGQVFKFKSMRSPKCMNERQKQNKNSVQGPHQTVLLYIKRNSPTK